MKAHVDAETCVGCGACVDICPDVFEMTDDDKAITKVDEIPSEHEETAREAAEECPVDAISVEEE